MHTTAICQCQMVKAQHVHIKESITEIHHLFVAVHRTVTLVRPRVLKGVGHVGCARQGGIRISMHMLLSI